MYSYQTSPWISLGKRLWQGWVVRFEHLDKAKWIIPKTAPKLTPAKIQIILFKLLPSQANIHFTFDGTVFKTSMKENDNVQVCFPFYWWIGISPLFIIFLKLTKEMIISKKLHILTPGGHCWQSDILLDISAKIKYKNFK